MNSWVVIRMEKRDNSAFGGLKGQFPVCIQENEILKHKALKIIFTYMS